MSATLTGRCLCGDVTYAFEPPVTRSVICHCESCQRHTGAPVAAFVGMRHSAWGWTGVPAAMFESSPSSERCFCPKCGASLAFCSKRLTGEMHFMLASLDDPDAFPPESHYFCAEARPWLTIDDKLTRYKGNGE